MNIQFEQIYEESIWTEYEQSIWMENEQLFWTETWTNILNRNMKFQFELI